MPAFKAKEHNENQIPWHLSVHISTSFTKGLVHSEVLEEIEKLVDKSVMQPMRITERNCIITVFDLDTKHILLTRGDRN